MCVDIAITSTPGAIARTDASAGSDVVDEVGFRRG